MARDQRVQPTCTKFHDHGVLGAGTSGSVKGEAHLGDGEGRGDLDTGMSAQSHGGWAAAQLGACGGQIGDGGGGQLRERRLSLCKAVIEHGQVIAGLDDPAPGELRQDARPHDLHQVADFLGAKAWQWKVASTATPCVALLASTAATADTFCRYHDHQTGRDVFVNRLEQVAQKCQGQTKIVFDSGMLAIPDDLRAAARARRLEVAAPQAPATSLVYSQSQCSTLSGECRRTTA